jgi:LysM repeat protein
MLAWSALHPSSAAAEGPFRVYIVRAGDTLSAVADDAGISLDTLVELNHIEDVNRVQPGTTLVLGTAPSVNKTPAPAAALRSRTYRVEAGDTLSGIADDTGVSVQTLRLANGLTNTNFLAVGALLTIPTAAAEQAPSEVNPRHVIASGETLSSIADRYSVTVSALVAENRITNPNLLRVGSLLVIPAKQLPFPSVEVINAVRRSASENHLDPYLVLGLSYLESGWQMDAVSHTGAIGMMQLMPETALSAIVDYRLATTNWRTSLLDNTRLGATYLNQLRLLSGGDIEVALASYYQGWRSVRDDGPLDETTQYVEDVLALAERFRSLAAIF